MFALMYTSEFTADKKRFTGIMNLQVCGNRYQFSGKEISRYMKKEKNIFVYRVTQNNHISNLQYYELC